MQGGRGEVISAGAVLDIFAALAVIFCLVSKKIYNAVLMMEWT